MVNVKYRVDNAESFINGLDFHELDQIDMEMYLFDGIVERKGNGIQTSKNSNKTSNCPSWDCYRLLKTRESGYSQSSGRCSNY